MDGTELMRLSPIAYIESQFPEKFGIPRQSGLIRELRGRVVFLPQFRSIEALRGIEGYSHLWLIWHFSKIPPGKWSPTVRPPRLGGNRRVGVFASRSPFRPNPIGLSCVELQGVDYEGKDAPALLIRGGDLMDGTPVLDIKPYLPFTDCYPEAAGGFTADNDWRQLRVEIPLDMLENVPMQDRESLREVLAADPRPHYHKDPDRVYGMVFSGLHLHFRVQEDRLIVLDIAKENPGK